MLWHEDNPPTPRPLPEPQPGEDRGKGLRQGPTPDSASTIRPSTPRSALPSMNIPINGSNTMRARAVRSDGVGIPDTIGRRHWRSHRQSAGSPKLYDIARALDVSESVAETRYYGAKAVNLQAAAIIAVLLCRGEVEDAATFEAPISAAMLGPVPDAMGDAQRACDESDALEDFSQSEWVATKSDAALDAYVRKLAADLYAGTRLLAVLKAEQAKRANK